ncbi:hypothetical protein B1992_02515 [Pseudoxanthomonas broegbernensis]|uniref:Uncharacterized protein n=1 Tax=Pseudoxanthomonas broegbernensis TaxID=83619 RepID=A0A7V8K7S5_9GAMM|nr:hypothetical protein [Pseudoxanthomonas broegbernensis]KAF1687557.1 hypothetical protein B1992_02515 [Pseudoxanthomonas broegbernensis]MBB6064568.1 hypothetical protein [Pseudoxanthomonas broegbernensis]
MSTVARRDFRSTPHRDARQTWADIVALLTASASGGAARPDLVAVAGVASSVIADQGPRDVPIIVTCDGPRTRIYCHYDDDALDESNGNEAALGFDPLKGEWQVSLPVDAEDLAWVTAALRAKSARVVARDRNETIETSTASNATARFVVDVEGFMKT